MPCVTNCTPGLSKHRICRPVRCDTDDDCPCAPTVSYSAYRSGKSNNSECKSNPEAFGTFVGINAGITGFTGPGFPD